MKNLNSNISELEEFGRELRNKENQKPMTRSMLMGIIVFMAFVSVSLYMLFSDFYKFWYFGAVLIFAVSQFYSIYRVWNFRAFTKEYTANGDIKESKLLLRFSRLKNKVADDSINGFDRNKLSALYKEIKFNIIVSNITRVAILILYYFACTEKIGNSFFVFSCFTVLIITISFFVDTLMEKGKLLALIVSCQASPNPNSDN